MKYKDRIVQAEKGSFCPLLFSTSGGVGPLCDNLHKRLASIIAHKRKEKYHVICFKRTRLRFALLKCVLMGLRGIWGKNTGQNEEQLADISALKIFPALTKTLGVSTIGNLRFYFCYVSKLFNVFYLALNFGIDVVDFKL